jgi:hypothetical protein
VEEVVEVLVAKVAVPKKLQRGSKGNQKNTRSMHQSR